MNKFDLLLLNELQNISYRLDEMQIKLEACVNLDERCFYSFIIELLDSNLKTIRKKIKSYHEHIDKNKKINFIK